jgi:hypothetical protein
MSETKKALVNLENILKTRYSKLLKLFLVLAILLIVWVAVVALGIVFLELGPAWALVTLDVWVSVLIVLFVVFIVLDVMFYIHYCVVRNKRVEAERPKPEFIDGKRVHEYTYPKGVEGGIFSKTYVSIDGHSMLRLRTIMIPPGELWVKKEE